MPIPPARAANLDGIVMLVNPVAPGMGYGFLTESPTGLSYVFYEKDNPVAFQTLTQTQKVKFDSVADPVQTGGWKAVNIV